MGHTGIGQPLCLLLQWPIRIVRRENDLGYVSHQERFNSTTSLVLHYVSDQMAIVSARLENNAMADHVQILHVGCPCDLQRDIAGRKRPRDLGLES